MSDYFTRDYFELLSRWQGKPFDRHTPGHDEAYKELSKAYNVVQAWAVGVMQELFLKGKPVLVRKPTNQKNIFSRFLWAKIYPTKGAPQELAYTVSISADRGFTVKIDVIDTKIDQKVKRERKSRGVATIRAAYDALRTSPDSNIVAELPAAKGLEMSLAELVQWSAKSINEFRPSYIEVAKVLNIDQDLSDEKPRGEGMQTKNTIKSENIIYYGPPGTGKTYKILDLLSKKYGRQDIQSKGRPADPGAVQRFSFVTFHQSYGYEEFVEGIRPVLNGDAGAHEVKYEIRDGEFKKLCSNARKAPDQRFAMVIDEINRGNISKIFGELITLIEDDKRDRLDGSAPPAEVALAYSGEKFSVPANVDIIGTMNTADRSLALLDTALRRRFKFVVLNPDTREEKDPADPDSAPLAGLVVNFESGVIDIRRMLECINKRIESLYDRDHCIGHAYFTGLAKEQDGAKRFVELADTFRNRIVPLLEEYFFEDWQKIRLVLADNQKDPQFQFIGESVEKGRDLSNLFGENSDLESYDAKQRYALQEPAFEKPQAYIGIYQPLES